MNLSSTSEKTWDMLLMLIFVNQLELALNQGLYRQYQIKEYNDSKIKGRIDINRHIKLNPLQNGKIAYSTREYTVMNPINQLILLADHYLEKKYNESYKSILFQRRDLQAQLTSLKSTIPDYKTLNV